MDYGGIIGNASRLKTSSLYKVTIADGTKQSLIDINSSIMKAHDAGLSVTRVSLPINFRQIDNAVPNSEIQTAVYYNIVTELEKKGYDVKLHLNKQQSIIEIAWSMRAELSELDMMRAKLMSLTRK